MPHPHWIIIPVHNRRATTRTCLERLRAQGLFERSTVCLVDDACTDGTREMVEAEFPEVWIADGDGRKLHSGSMDLHLYGPQSTARDASTLRRKKYRARNFKTNVL